MITLLIVFLALLTVMGLFIAWKPEVAREFVRKLWPEFFGAKIAARVPIICSGREGGMLIAALSIGLILLLLVLGPRGFD